MAENLEIERPLKPGEAGFTKVGVRTFQQVFMDKLHEKEQKYTKLHKPYDRACAQFDFSDKYEAVQKEIERAEGAIASDDPRLKIDFGDLERYGTPDRFMKLGESDDIINRTVDGIVVPTKIGVTEFYQCKQRGHGIAVYVPLDIMAKKSEQVLSTTTEV